MDPKKCVFSGSTENLNTSMTINVDGVGRVEVWVSDEYADKATPAAVKEAYMKQQKEYFELLEKAKQLGLTLVPQGQQAPPPTARQEITVGSNLRPIQVANKKESQVGKSIVAEDNGHKIVDGDTADRQIRLTNVTTTSSSIQTPGSEYAIRSDEKSSTNLKEGEVAEIGYVKAAAGVDVAIPVKRSGKTGTTEIRVINTGGDVELQKRFKNMANHTVAAPDNRNCPDFARGGYNVRFIQCGLCNGTGVAMKKTCPKCNGAGETQVSSF